MCKQKILVQNNDGYVLLCNSCAYYSLAFGNIIVRLNLDEFNALYQQIEYLTETVFCNDNPLQKRITIQLNCEEVAMIVSYEELGAFYNLFQEAAFSNKLFSLLNSVNISN